MKCIILVLMVLLLPIVDGIDVLVLIDNSWFTDDLETWLNLQWINPDGSLRARAMFMQVGYYAAEGEKLPLRSWANSSDELMSQVAISENEKAIKSTVVFSQIARNITLNPDYILVLVGGLLAPDKFPTFPRNSFIAVHKKQLFVNAAKLVGPARALFNAPSPFVFIDRDLSINNCNHPLSRPYCSNGTLSKCLELPMSECLSFKPQGELGCVFDDCECVNELPPCWYPDVKSCEQHSDKCFWNLDTLECDISQTPAPTAAAIATWTYKLVKEDVECRSHDKDLSGGKRVTLHECAAACADTSGCRFFIHGKNGQTGSKVGNCFWEQTSSEYCPEGFDTDSYIMYKMIFDVRIRLEHHRYAVLIVLGVAVVFFLIVITCSFIIFPRRHYVAGLPFELISYRMSDAYEIEEDPRLGDLNKERYFIGKRGDDNFFMCKSAKVTSDGGVERRELFQEMSILVEYIKTEEVVHYVGWCSGSGGLYIMFTTLYDSNLHEYLEELNSTGDEQMLRSRRVTQMGCALKIADFVHNELHSKNLAHMNITSKSVLVESVNEEDPLQFRLGGFQYCTKDGVIRSREPKTLDHRWCSSETLSDTLQSGYPVRGRVLNDIWMFGCLFCEIWTGKQPFENITTSAYDDDEDFAKLTHKIMTAIADGEDPAPMTSNDTVLTAIRSCWKPFASPTFTLKDAVDKIRESLGP
eukprot:TRINITY_DN828_c0_g1_i6.p1 TRINITY_DN828_c0_g1~~TRINITY_DN828_c0_g1_i6.p1  ORF type:complete len:711 (+),score=129.08 TRINITY_DN828_c0_g1_i6:47-2134(+)